MLVRRGPMSRQDLPRGGGPIPGICRIIINNLFFLT